MVKPKRDRRFKRRRTSLEIEEEQTRTLYIRIPHTIKNENEIKDLFFGEFKLKIPRQSSRHCHVIFPNVQDKLKNLKTLKTKMIDGKPIFAAPPRPIDLEKKAKRKKQKKIVIPEPKDEPVGSKYIFVSNIPPGVKASEIREAFPGSVTVGLLKGLKNNSKQARVKMSTCQLCLQYANNQAEWPTIHGQKVKVAVSENKKKKKKPKKKSKPLKIYDGETEQKDVIKINEKSEEKNIEESDGEYETESDAEEDKVESEEEEEETEKEEEETEKEEEETEKEEEETEKEEEEIEKEEKETENE